MIAALYERYMPPAFPSPVPRCRRFYVLKDQTVSGWYWVYFASSGGYLRRPPYEYRLAKGPFLTLSGACAYIRKNNP